MVEKFIKYIKYTGAAITLNLMNAASEIMDFILIIYDGFIGSKIIKVRQNQYGSTFSNVKKVRQMNFLFLDHPVAPQKLQQHTK